MSSRSSVDGVPLIVLENEAWRVGVLPGTGASLAFGQIRHRDGWLDLLRATPVEDYRNAENCASFALLPWSNRVRDALLTYDGTHYRLRANAPDGTAIHGTAREYPWSIEGEGSAGLVATFDSREFHGVNFPWKFSARLVYRLEGRCLFITTTLRNEDTVPMPAGLGHHPYFHRRLAGDGDEVLLRVPCDEYYVLDRALPAGPSVPVEPRVDFRASRPLGSEFIDDCLTGRQQDAPIRMAYPRSGRTITIGADDVFSHVVVYVPVGAEFFAVEPVSNANDGFTLYERGVLGSGIFVLEPGEERQGSIWLDVEA